MAKKGGYQIVDVKALTYALALTYADCGKPLLIYDGVNIPYFADSIEKKSDRVVIYKNNSSITITQDDAIIKNGFVSEKYISVSTQDENKDGIVMKLLVPDNLDLTFTSVSEFIANLKDIDNTRDYVELQIISIIAQSFNSTMVGNILYVDFITDGAVASHIDSTGMAEEILLNINAPFNIVEI